MKRFSQLNLTKGVIVLFTLGLSFILCSAIPDYYYSALQVQAQVQQQEPPPQPPPRIGIKIISPIAGQQVPVGELRISGISTDNATTDCTVYADWNDQKPFQKAIATGLGGTNDYSTWTFTYTQNYHLITNGTNNLTSKLSCLSNPTNVTKWNSVNVIGEVDLTAPKNDASSREELTSFEGQNLTTIGNQAKNITDVSQTNTSLNNA